MTAINRILNTVSTVRLDSSHPVIRLAAGSTSGLTTTSLWLSVEPRRGEA
jgi:hypothetical protein